jgi:hypothetical protein
MKSANRFVIPLIILGFLIVAPMKTEAATGSCPKYEALLKKHKLPVKTFSAIMWRESRCEPKAVGWNYKSGKGYWSCPNGAYKQYKKCKAISSHDLGLLQINSSWRTLTAQTCGGKWGDMTVLLKPDCNLKVAAILYNEGKGLSNWSGRSSKD